MKKNHVIFSACFFLILVAGFVSYFVFPQKDFSEDENRFLTKRPEFSLEKLLHGDFTKQMNDYATDQFALRSKAITVKTTAQKLALVKDCNGVYFGKNNSLILKKSASEFEDKRFAYNLSAIDSFAQLHKDINMSVLIAPTAAAIWPERLPGLANEFNQEEKLQQAKDYFSQDENILFVDTLEDLRNHNTEQLYYNTDHHWTSKGAYYAYGVFCVQNGLMPQRFEGKDLTKDFYGTLYSKVLAPGIKPDTITQFIPEKEETITVSHNNGETKTDSIYDESKLKIKDKYQYFLGGNEGEVTINTSVKNGKHLLIVKDSYANSFVPFLTSDYESIHLIDLRYFNEGLSMYMKAKKINEVLILYNLNNFDEDSSIVKLQMP